MPCFFMDTRGTRQVPMSRLKRLNVVYLRKVLSTVLQMARAEGSVADLKRQESGRSVVLSASDPLCSASGPRSTLSPRDANNQTPEDFREKNPQGSAAWDGFQSAGRSMTYGPRRRSCRSVINTYCVGVRESPPPDTPMLHVFIKNVFPITASL